MAGIDTVNAVIASSHLLSAPPASCSATHLLLLLLLAVPTTFCSSCFLQCHPPSAPPAFCSAMPSWPSGSQGPRWAPLKERLRPSFATSPQPLSSHACKLAV
eukprot:1153286-Pelagomonas_calceolata.AAC.2